MTTLVDQDWVERLCTLQVLANHGDREASDTLEAWCDHDSEARDIRIALTSACRAIEGTDER